MIFHIVASPCVIPQVILSILVPATPTKPLPLVGLIKQFLRDVDWGSVDYLIVDTPPGTSDEHLSIVQYLSDCHVDGAIVITTPQVSPTPVT